MIRLKAVWFFFLLPSLLSGQSYVSDGESLLQENKPEQALVYLQAGLETEGPSQKIYHYLSLAYRGTGQNELALNAIDKGLAFPGSMGYLMWYNKGNIAFQLGQLEEAEEAFSRSLTLSPGFHSNFLNRANTRLEREDFNGALEDYQIYLDLKPQDPQASQISEMISLLQGHISDLAEQERLAEAQRLAELARQREEEELARLEEERRLAEEEQMRIAEEQRLAEEERRRAELLERIRGTLEDAGNDSQSLTEGTTGVEDFTDEFTLDG